MSRATSWCILLVISAHACKGDSVDSRLLGMGSPRAAEARPPEGVDLAKWQDLARGLANADEIDLALLSDTMILDADWYLETQPYLLARVGLWMPILKALPTGLRAKYQESVVDALDSDPGPRTEQLIIALADDGDGVRRGIGKYALFARTRDGLLLDLVQFGVEKEPEEDGGAEATAVVLEPLSPEQRTKVRQLMATARHPPREYALSEEVTLLLAEDYSTASLLTPDGIVEVSRRPASAGGIIDALYRVVRRAGEGRPSREVAENRVAKGNFRGLDDGGRLTFELILDGSLALSGSYSSDDARSLERLEKRLREPEYIVQAREEAKHVLPRTIENVIASSRFVREGTTLRFELRAPIGDLIDDLGGVALAMPEQASAIGAGLDAATIRAAVDTPAPRLTQGQLAEQVTAGASLRFMPPGSPRHQAIAAWLEKEGTLQKFVSATPFGRIPVTISECGQANAFYVPGRQAIMLCYELAADMLDKLSRAFKTADDLGRAVVGGMLFILLHEYGHALIHLRQLPATGMEEDAVDQLAALTLIELGDQGILWAAMAMRWFFIAEQLGHHTPHWDEHSANGRRAFNITCLIYGSAPDRFGQIAGTDALPRRRATRCPAEFLKAKNAWGTLLEREPSARGAPSPTSGPVAPAVPAAPPEEPRFAQCTDLAGVWDFTTTVTAASKSGVGTRGYYRMTVMPGCEATLEKLGFDAIRFAPDRVQRGYGRLERSGATYRTEVGLARAGAVDYTAAFTFELGQGLEGTWRYTGESFKTTGFSGTLTGRRP